MAFIAARQANRPVSIGFIAEYPTGIILALNDKDALLRNE